MYNIALIIRSIPILQADYCHDDVLDSAQHGAVIRVPAGRLLVVRGITLSGVAYGGDELVGLSSCWRWAQVDVTDRIMDVTGAEERNTSKTFM